ncbi:MAG: ABC transporter [Ignavibacteriales bacterium UTCHB2]|jgi:ATP-binding cassette subfamily B protein|nr:MAG: putative multidrug resistance ABC transporter ATP-binding/permease protein YheI [Ignavibacteria bacterium ADurb.Bin266]OQY73923.1 MAG: ABC transporter [Ignavibacteriales bacterium UTCHB2]HQI39916.1 ABC transporter ATP-binding protein [Ignavibacteriaceae bacterium]
MKNLLTLKKYFVRYKTKLLWGIVFILISNAMTVYVPILLKDAIDELQKNTTSTVLLKYAALIVGTSIVGGIFRYSIRQTIIVVSREIEYDLRGDFWSHIQKLPLRYFQNNSTGNIMSHATNDINAIRSFIGPAVMYSIDTSIRLSIVVAIMMSMNFSLTLYALLPLPFLSYGVYRVGRLIHEKYVKIQENFSQLTTRAQENFSGIRVIKSYVREENEIKRWKELSREFLRKNMNLIRIQAIISPILTVITGISIIVVIWIGGGKVINGEMSLGEIAAFVAYLSILIWPVIAFGWVMNIIQQAEASMKRLNKIFAEPYEIDDSDKTDFAITELKGKIEFKNVSFRYSDNLPEVLKNINIKIPVGSTLAIVGHTGSGKTSLINLIPRLYDVSEGEVKIDGRNVKEIPLDVLRTDIAVVQQESFLFSDTVSGNISYGLKEIDLEKVKEVSRIANFDKDVETFTNGYETIVGERGITFSGGQKQRASLARALATDPKILILDDSFSAVDTQTEEKILKNLKEFMKNRTSIIISHRISTVKDADNIIVIHDQTIVEQGTHSELVALNGIYADLHYKQLLEKELEELN